MYAITGEAILSTLGEHLARLPFRVQRQFRRLSEDEKRTVAGEFARHVRNCRSIDCNIDPQWLPEAIQDVKKGWLGDSE